MSGWCDFCQIWHSGSCCHPGRKYMNTENRTYKPNSDNVLLEEKIDKLQIQLNMLYNQVARLVTKLEKQFDRERHRPHQWNLGVFPGYCEVCGMLYFASYREDCPGPLPEEIK